jgi:hypothetical protein
MVSLFHPLTCVVPSSVIITTTTATTAAVVAVVVAAAVAAATNAICGPPTSDLLHSGRRLRPQRVPGGPDRQGGGARPLHRGTPLATITRICCAVLFCAVLCCVGVFCCCSRCYVSCCICCVETMLYCTMLCFYVSLQYGSFYFVACCMLCCAVLYFIVLCNAICKYQILYYVHAGGYFRRHPAPVRHEGF